MSSQQPKLTESGDDSLKSAFGGELTPKKIFQVSRDTKLVSSISRNTNPDLTKSEDNVFSSEHSQDVKLKVTTDKVNERRQKGSVGFQSNNNYGKAIKPEPTKKDRSGTSEIFYPTKQSTYKTNGFREAKRGPRRPMGPANSNQQIDTRDDNKNHTKSVEQSQDVMTKLTTNHTDRFKGAKREPRGSANSKQQLDTRDGNENHTKSVQHSQDVRPKIITNHTDRFKGAKRGPRGSANSKQQLDTRDGNENHTKSVQHSQDVRPKIITNHTNRFKGAKRGPRGSANSKQQLDTRDSNKNQDVRPKVITNRRVKRDQKGSEAFQPNYSHGSAAEPEPIKKCRNSRAAKSRNRGSEISSVEVLDYYKLCSYEDKDSSSILLKISHNQSGLSELLNLPHPGQNMIQVTLSVLSKACKCYSAPQNLSNLLIKLLNSSFFTETIPNILMGLTLGQTDDKKTQKTILNICVLLETLLMMIPNSFVNVSGIVTMVTYAVDNFRSASIPIDDEILRALTELQMIQKSNYKKMKIQKQKDTEGEPPDDFRNIPIIPTMEDINTNTLPFLRKNKVNSAYESLHDYLDVQFRLLREDFIYPLRNGIQEYLNSIASNEKGHRFQDIRLYTDVTVVRSVCSRTDLLHRLHLKLSNLKHVNWQISKRLIYGSLVCLSEDNFQTFYLATVSDRDPDLLKNGYIDVRFEHNLEDIFAISINQRFVMVETTAYFEAYKHVLKGLQTVQTLPFAQYIVEMETEVNSPRYLVNNVNNSVFDLGPLMDENVQVLDDQRMHTESSINILDPLSWPKAELFNFNESQYVAFKTALTKEFSIIQGPPGTGKTYLGLKVVRALLLNRQKWNNGPILIVCYTNHALDQFLEGISKFYNGKIVRVGGRVSSENIEKYSLKKWKYDAHFGDLKGLNDLHLNTLKHMQEKIEITGQGIEASKDGILKEDALRHVMAPKHDAELNKSMYLEIMSRQGFMVSGVSSVIVEWLGIGVSGTLIEEIINSKNGNMDVVVSDEEHDVDEESYIPLNNRFLDVDDTDVNKDAFNEVMHKSKEVRKDTLAFELSSLNKKQFNDGFQLPKPSRKKLKQRLEHCLHAKDMMTEDEVCNVDSIWQLDNKDRWRLYRYWVSQHCEKIKHQIIENCKEYRELCDTIKEVNFQKDKRILADASVIAMTTTGAARYQSILEEIHPRIIVIEEAAEVLEAHVITTITKGCEQLILIGDHKQLRPNPNVFKLAVKYNLDISLFERMIKNGVRCDCLGIQHRMRPEISRLMKPIYPSLQDHDSVAQFEQIKGITANIFFINHGEFEQPDDDDNKSHSNSYEAEYVFRLTDYLLKQGYPRSQITILTTYSGQLLEIKKLMPKELFEGVRITAVDNFQGEENEIIILSLVRCNNRQKIGFLKTENRICVALSRAKRGLYVIGNFDILAAQSPVWNKMTVLLKQTNELGNTLKLRCQNHPKDKGIEVNTPTDFCLAPAGGCQKPCVARLDCGHTCAMMCHPVDPDHVEYKCQKPCVNFCKTEHPCKLKCCEDCGDCQVMVEKTMPVCGHTDMVKCYKPPSEHKCTKPCIQILDCGHLCGNPCGFNHRCKTIIKKTWLCKHTGDALCPTAESSKCRQPCGKTLECGHLCIGDCSVCFNGKLHRPCNLKCTKSLLCEHICTSICSDCPPCKEPCKNRCVHNKCNRTCGQICVKCVEPCTWRCRHFKCTKRCYEPCDRPTCDVPCYKKLRCGHKCIGLCGEPCPKLCRICNKDKVTEIFFGTEDEKGARFVELPDCKHIIEYKSLDNWMKENTSESSTNEIQMKACPKCKTTIRKCVRYGSLIKRLDNNINEVKIKLGGDQSVKEALREENALLIDNIRLSRNAPLRELNEAATTANKLASIGNQLKFIVKCQDLESRLTALRNKLVRYFDRSKLGVELEYIRHQLEDFKQWIKKQRLVFSQQEINDAETECRRLLLCIDLQKKENDITEKDLIPVDIKETMIKIQEKFKEGCLMSDECEKDIQKVFKEIDKLVPKSSLGISQNEKVKIVEAMKFNRGHWFKCKNGHIYAIGDCGGAMVEATCPECKEAIGGTRHRLRSDNTLAVEMDGSRHAAWSEATNLENYRF